MSFLKQGVWKHSWLGGEAKNGGRSKMNQWTKVAQNWYIEPKSYSQGMVQKNCYCSIKLASYESYHVFKAWDSGQGKGQGQTRLDQARTKTKNASLQWYNGNFFHNRQIGGCKIKTKVFI